MKNVDIKNRKKEVMDFSETFAFYSKLLTKNEMSIYDLDFKSISEFQKKSEITKIRDVYIPDLNICIFEKTESNMSIYKKALKAFKKIQETDKKYHSFKKEVKNAVTSVTINEKRTFIKKDYSDNKARQEIDSALSNTIDYQHFVNFKKEKRVNHLGKRTNFNNALFIILDGSQAKLTYSEVKFNFKKIYYKNESIFLFKEKNQSYSQFNTFISKVESILKKYYNENKSENK